MTVHFAPADAGAAAGVAVCGQAGATARSGAVATTASTALRYERRFWRMDMSAQTLVCASRADVVSALCFLRRCKPTKASMPCLVGGHTTTKSSVSYTYF